MSDLQQATSNPGASLLPDAPASVREKIDAMSLQQIEIRRNEILQAAAGNYDDLSTEMLHELAYIAKRLRRTNVGPPKEPKAAKKAAKSIDDIF